MYKLGIDVGDTNTDAVLINDKLEIVAGVKYPTTADIYDGIIHAIRTVCSECNIDRSDITQAIKGCFLCLKLRASA